MENFLIRACRAGDENEIIDLWLQCNLIVSHNHPGHDFRRKLKVNPEWFFAGVLESKIIATCMAGYEGHRGWINYLAVAPDYRRQGIATQMMQTAEARLRKAGCPKINLQVRASNKEIIRFYESIGYSDDAVVSLGKRLIHDPPYRAVRTKGQSGEESPS